MLDHKLRCNDAEQREKEDQDRQFKYQAETEQHQEDQIEILINVNEQYNRPLKTNQKTQDVRKGHEISKSDTCKKQEYGRKEKSRNGAALVLIKRRSHEEPDLVKDPGGGNHYPQVNADSDQEVQVPRRMRVDEFGIEMGGLQGRGH